MLWAAIESCLLIISSISSRFKSLWLYDNTNEEKFSVLMIFEEINHVIILSKVLQHNPAYRVKVVSSARNYSSIGAEL